MMPYQGSESVGDWLTVYVISGDILFPELFHNGSQSFWIRATFNHLDTCRQRFLIQPGIE